MQEQIQQKSQAKTQPVQQTTGQELPVEQKKTNWLIWLLIALIVSGAGVGAYFLFFK